MPKFHNTLKVKASPDKAWSIVGDLAEVDKWIPGITEVRVEGNNKRICTFADGHIQNETISDYSNEKRSYSYTIEGVTGLQNNYGSFSVKPDGKGSAILWDAEFEVVDPSNEAQITQMWEAATRQIFESLRRLIDG